MNGPKITLTRVTPLLPDVKRASKQNAVMKEALVSIQNQPWCMCECFRHIRSIVADALKEVEKI